MKNNGHDDMIHYKYYEWKWYYTIDVSNDQSYTNVLYATIIL